jgi:hypothetical protein
MEIEEYGALPILNPHTVVKFSSVADPDPESGADPV